MNKDRYTSIAEQLDAMDEPHLAELVEQVTRMRRSLCEARELIEEMVKSEHGETKKFGLKFLEVKAEVFDAAHKWLEENGDA